MSSEKSVHDIGRRIKEFRKFSRLTQKEFAKKFDIGQSHVSMVERGESGISRTLLEHICSKLPANKDWLLTGKGPMILPEMETRLTSEPSRAFGLRDMLSTFTGKPPSPYAARGFIDDAPEDQDFEVLAEGGSQVMEVDAKVLDLDRRVTKLEGAVSFLAQALKVSIPCFALLLTVASLVDA
jgi:transcriptional regulator with XRE-family HTH domain